jgi:ABC-2 type transport system ATP-binding protein
MDWAIETDGLTKWYRTGYAVKDLALRVPRGSVFGLLGRNSAGKTTTIRMLMSLARPTEGEARVLGLNPAVERERVAMLARVGYVPEVKDQSLGLPPEKLLALNRGFYPETWSDALARKVVDRLELPLKTPFSKLSMGNKTKAVLAMAIAQASELLILDEPTTGLDPVAIDELLRLLVEDCTADGRTVFLSTHQLQEVEQIADYIAILDAGRVVVAGPLDTIRSDFRRVTAVGNRLPERGEAAEIVSAAPAGHAMEYVLQSNAENFAARLRAQGAEVVSAEPMSLNEIFLAVCRKAENSEAASVLMEASGRGR